MTLVKVLSPSTELASPPPGSVNVRIGDSIVGPGGTWIPCATKFGRRFFAGLFQVGPGQHQVCETSQTFENEADAFLCAVELATSAAA